MKGLGGLVESRMRDIQESKQKLIRVWSPYIGAVKSFLKESENRELSDYDAMQIAQCLENAAWEAGKRQQARLYEETTSSDVAFLGVQLPVIAAMLPSLVLNQIGITQTLERRTGAVFYMDAKYGQKKGSIAEGDVMLSAKTGHERTKAGRRYATEYVLGEALGAAGGTVYSGTLDYYPVVAGTMVVTDGVETFTDNGSGVLVTDNSSGSNGTINYTTGVFSVTFAVTTVAAPTADYKYNYEKATNGVPEVDLELTSETIAAEDFPLRAKYSIGAAVDLEKAHGLNFENIMTNYLGGEIKFEIDHFGIEKIVDAAEDTSVSAGSFGTWDATVGSGQEWVWKKFQLIDYIIKGSNQIFSKTLRGAATFIICGNNGARVISQLAPHFVPDSKFGKVPPTGPMVIGTLDGRLVIQDPFLSTNRIYLGYKGQDILTSGLIYAPYIPLLSTPTLMTSDLKGQKGFLSASGFHITNAGFYSYGDISNLG